MFKALVGTLHVGYFSHCEIAAQVPFKSCGSPSFKPEIFLLWSPSINHHIIIPPYYRACVKAPSHLCMTFFFVHHIWSLLCCFTVLLFWVCPMIPQKIASLSVWELGRSVVLQIYTHAWHIQIQFRDSLKLQFYFLLIIQVDLKTISIDEDQLWPRTVCKS